MRSGQPSSIVPETIPTPIHATLKSYIQGVFFFFDEIASM